MTRIEHALSGGCASPLHPLRPLRGQVREGVASLHQGGTPPRFLVLDDGWQTVRHDDGTGIVKEIVADADLAAAKNEPSQ